jgi:acyl-CoA synthetase (AMP-forming)/AMP-acid ligase II
MIKLEDIKTITAARGEMPALVSPDYTLSWSALCASVRHLVEVVRDLCAEAPIAQAAFISDNRPELVTLMAAFATEGIPLTGVDYSLPAPLIARALRKIEPSVVFVASRAIGLAAARELQAAHRGRLIDLDGVLPGAIALSTLQLPRKAPPREPQPRLPFRSVVFTSGTSGDAKPVLRSRSIDGRRFAYFTQRYGFHACDRFLVSIPLYHVAGSGWARHFMGLGATLYLAPVLRHDVQAQWVLQHGITATVTTPPSVGGLVDALTRAGRQRDTRLRFVLVGGKNFSPSQKRRALDALGPVVYEYYGSTETGVNTIAEPHDLAVRPDSVGRPYDGNRVVILDDQDRFAPTGQHGRVAVSSYLMMDRYADCPANEVQVAGERFLITPDRGYFDEDGRLYVLNRSSGKDGNFDTYGVEETLRALPGVRDLALMLRPDLDNGVERVADCALVLDDAASAAELCRRVRELLLHAGLAPRHVRALQAVPYSLSGKVRWNELQQQLEAASQRDRMAA